MADSNFRPFRSRDSIAREDVDPTSDAARDPLAELARIIGQSNRVNDFDRAPRHEPRRDAVETLHEPLPANAERDWAADDGYAEPDAPEQYAEEDYVEPRLPDPYPADRASGRYDREDERAPSIASQYSEPAEPYDDPMMTRRRTTRAIATRSRRAPPAGSRLWRRNPMTTNTKPKTNGTTERIVSLTTPKTMTMKTRPGLGAAVSSWFWPCWAWS